MWSHAPKHRFKGPQAVKIAAMSAVLALNCVVASKQDVTKAANIPGGEFTMDGCKNKEATRMKHSVKEGQVKRKRKK